MQTTADSDASLDAPDADIGDIESEVEVKPASDSLSRRPRRLFSKPWHTMVFGCSIVVAMAALLGWSAICAQQSHRGLAQQSQYLQVARQGALNLTTIDWQHAEADVRRILDGAAGEFRDDFAKRSQPFIDLVKQGKAKTVGTITAAGLESESANSARALVAVSVQTSNDGAPDQEPHVWRMRIDVSRIGGEVKVSNVGFVA
jgi:Mce-associated membrane protein